LRVCDVVPGLRRSLSSPAAVDATRGRAEDVKLALAERRSAVVEAFMPGGLRVDMAARQRLHRVAVFVFVVVALGVGLQ
jgi:hypothetical protein